MGRESWGGSLGTAVLEWQSWGGNLGAGVLMRESWYGSGSLGAGVMWRFLGREWGLEARVLRREFTLNFSLNYWCPQSDYFHVELSFLKHKRSSDDDLITELTTLSSFQNTTYF